MIRERRGKRGVGCLQVISVRYDPATNRNRQRVVAALPLDAEGLPPRVAAELTETERRNAEAFFVARNHRLRERRIFESVAALVVQGHRVCTALADPDDRPVVMQAAELYGLGVSLAELLSAAATAGLRGRIRVPARRRQNAGPEGRSQSSGRWTTRRAGIPAGTAQRPEAKGA